MAILDPEISEIEAYVDESGAVKPGGPFVAGIWFTKHPLLWRKIIEERREDCHYGYELHFHKISGTASDLRAFAVRQIFRKLFNVKHSWYSRMIYVRETYLDLWKGFKAVDIYDTMISEMLLRFVIKAKADLCTVVIDEKNRPLSDNFIPDGLDALLNTRSTALGGPRIRVQVRSSKHDDLLQLVDLLTAAVRQIYHPSGNINKYLACNLIEPLINDRIGIWEWRPNKQPNTQ